MKITQSRNKREGQFVGVRNAAFVHDHLVWKGKRLYSYNNTKPRTRAQRKEVKMLKLDDAFNIF